MTHKFWLDPSVLPSKTSHISQFSDVPAYSYSVQWLSMSADDLVNKEYDKDVASGKYNIFWDSISAMQTWLSKEQESRSLS